MAESRSSEPKALPASSLFLHFAMADAAAFPGFCEDGSVVTRSMELKFALTEPVRTPCEGSFCVVRPAPAPQRVPSQCDPPSPLRRQSSSQEATAPSQEAVLALGGTSPITAAVATSWASAPGRRKRARGDARGARSHAVVCGTAAGAVACVDLCAGGTAASIVSRLAPKPNGSSAPVPVHVVFLP